MVRLLRRSGLAIAICTFAVAVTSAAEPARIPTGLLVPAYIYPAGEGLTAWNDLIAAADKVPIVAIINPASGPGTQVNPEIKAVFERANRSKTRPASSAGNEHRP